MRSVVRHSLLLLLSFSLSYWILLGFAGPAGGEPATKVRRIHEIEITPDLVPAPAPPLPAASEVLGAAQAPPATAPPPPEAGTPEGGMEGHALAADPDAPGRLALEQARDEVARLMRDAELLDAAEHELASEAALGFRTAFRCAPEEQLELARFFGESIVLVPRSALDETAPDRHYFELNPRSPGRIRRLEGAPPLERFRQYRDLLDFEYSRLPEELRALRTRVPSRSEIYLFAALIPAREWALVISRREEALGRAGDRPEPVRQYTLSYRRLAGSTFDVRVEEIRFADQSVWLPGDVP